MLVINNYFFTHAGNKMSFEQTFKNIDDVLWKEAGCSSELDHGFSS
jgi:type I restriction enzyme M protein